MTPTLKQNLMAEFIGTMFLVTVAIGSTILPLTLPGWTISLTVFINAVAVAMVLFALIETFGSVSGAHFNPAVTLAILAAKEIKPKRAALYMIAQIAGGFVGLLIVGLMFYSYDPNILVVSSNVKDSGQVLAEFVGTFLLIGVIFGCVRGGSKHTGLSVAFVVGGMLVTTSSTMFANPAVTLNRMFTYAICGVAPISGILFIMAEVVGALAAAAVFAIIFPAKLKEKCEPFECPMLTGGPRPIIVDTERPSAQPAKCEPYDCPPKEKRQRS